MAATSSQPLLWYYTSLTTALSHVLPEGRLRLSPYGDMRDPRESQEWVPFIKGAGTTERSRALREKLRPETARIQQRFKLLSMTRDDDPTGDIWQRGYAKPRMWEQYANRHRGVCFAFDKEELIDIARRQLSGHVNFWSDVVEYRDELLDLTISANDANTLTPAAALANAHAAGYKQLLFRKLRDWAGEAEFRFVVETKDGDPRNPVIDDVSPALRKIYVGFESDYAADLILAWMKAVGRRDISLCVLWWVNGRPTETPIM